MEEEIYNKTVCGNIQVICTIKDGRPYIQEKVLGGGYRESQLMPPKKEVIACHEEIHNLLMGMVAE
jgi:hypothetical protein